jgi:hypothetical protein
MILTKVILGKFWDVCTQGHATSAQAGYNSVCGPSLLRSIRSQLYFVKQVVYNPATSPTANETIVYTDDAIRPVFLIIF